MKCTNNSVTGLPECGFDDPVQGKDFRALSTVLAPVLEASDTVYPRIYIAPHGGDCVGGCSHADIESWIKALVAEAGRLMQHRPLSVFPVMWQWYSGALNNQPLSDIDRRIAMTAPYDAGRRVWWYLLTWRVKITRSSCGHTPSLTLGRTARRSWVASRGVRLQTAPTMAAVSR